MATSFVPLPREPRRIRSFELHEATGTLLPSLSSAKAFVPRILGRSPRLSDNGRALVRTKKGAFLFEGLGPLGSTWIPTLVSPLEALGQEEDAKEERLLALSREGKREIFLDGETAEELGGRFFLFFLPKRETRCWC